MFKRAFVALVCASSICIGTALVKCKSACSLAIFEVEALADELYRKAYNKTIPDMSDEQWEKILFIYSTYLETKSKLTNERDALQDLFRQEAHHPTPSPQVFREKQEAINRKDTAIDEAAVIAAFQMRSVLTKKQVDQIFLFDIDKEFAAVKLSDEQQQKMRQMVVASKAQKDLLTKQITQLEYEIDAEVTQRPKVDEAATLDKVKRVAELKGELASEDLRLRLKLRSLLDWQQLNKQFNSHRGDLFGNIGISQALDSKIMELHCLREGVTAEGRTKINDLSCDLMSKFQLADSTQQSLSEIQQKIDDIANATRMGETEYVIKIRGVLPLEADTRLVALMKTERAGGKLPPYPPEGSESDMSHMMHGGHMMHEGHMMHDASNAPDGNMHSSHTTHVHGEKMQEASATTTIKPEHSSEDPSVEQMRTKIRFGNKPGAAQDSSATQDQAATSTVAHKVESASGKKVAATSDLKADTSTAQSADKKTSSSTKKPAGAPKEIADQVNSEKSGARNSTDDEKLDSSEVKADIRARMTDQDSESLKSRNAPLFKLAAAAADAKRYTLAIETLEDIVSSYENSGLRSDDYFRALKSLGNSYVSSGNEKQGEATFKKELSLANGGTREVDAKIALGLLYYNQKKYSEAEQFFKEASATLGRIVGDDHPVLKPVLIMQSECLKQLNRNKEADAVKNRASVMPDLP